MNCPRGIEGTIDTKFVKGKMSNVVSSVISPGGMSDVRKGHAEFRGEHRGLIEERVGGEVAEVRFLGPYAGLTASFEGYFADCYNVRRESLCVLGDGLDDVIFDKLVGRDGVGVIPARYPHEPAFVAYCRDLALGIEIYYQPSDVFIVAGGRDDRYLPAVAARRDERVGAEGALLSSRPRRRVLRRARGLRSRPEGG